jgi:lysophospholipid acyltransferase
MIWVVFVISAWWHGFFMIYYIFFIEWGIFNEVTKAFYKSKSKFSLYLFSKKLISIPSKVRLVIAWIYTHVIVNETALPVALLEAKRWIKFSGDLYWSS